MELNPLEEAHAYQQLLEDFQCTQEELSRRIVRSSTDFQHAATAGEAASSGPAGEWLGGVLSSGRRVRCSACLTLAQWKGLLKDRHLKAFCTRLKRSSPLAMNQSARQLADVGELEDTAPSSANCRVGCRSL